jgi:hypothetical protein
LADLIASHRVVTQRTLERVRRLELELGVPPSHYVPGDSAARSGRAGAGDADPLRDGVDLGSVRATAHRGS